MDYIDAYEEARINNFESNEDKLARKNFWELARKDFRSARKRGLIREMTFDDHQLLNEKRDPLTEEEKEIIRREPHIPSWIICQYYQTTRKTVKKLRGLSTK